MSWGSRSNVDLGEKPDIVEELYDADSQLKREMDRAMISNPEAFVRDSLYLRAAKEIEKLRRILGIVGN